MDSFFIYNIFASAASCNKGFFLLPPWYEYLNVNAACQVVVSGAPGSASFTNGIFGVPVLVGLAIIDILLRIAGLLAIIYVIYGGIQYILSRGEPDKTAKAQGSIINALIGLAIAIISVALVSFVGNKLAG